MLCWQQVALAVVCLHDSHLLDTVAIHRGVLAVFHLHDNVRVVSAQRHHCVELVTSATYHP